MSFTSFVNKSIMASLCLLVLFMSVPNASAQRWDHATKITINQPFAIPGMALPAGTYVMKLKDVSGTRTAVQILNADETKSYAIVLGVPDYRLETPEETEITFYENDRGAPPRMHAWFYPGYNYGLEFVYPRREALEIAKASGDHVIATSAPQSPKEPEPAQLKNEPLVAIEPDGKEVEVAAVHPEPAPPVAEQPAPAVTEEPIVPAEPVLTAQNETPEEAITELPSTATPLPFLGLTGLLAIGAAGALRLMRKS
jgi:hypothetical protein